MSARFERQVDCDGIGNQDEREAAFVHDRLARALFGVEAKLNLPDESSPAASLVELRREKHAQYKQTTTSRFNGVSWGEEKRGWVAVVTVDHTHYFLGYHDEDEDAARACDRKRWELRCDRGYNFPDGLPAAKGRARRARG